MAVLSSIVVFLLCFSMIVSFVQSVFAIKERKNMTLEKFEKKLTVLSARGDSFAVAKFFKNNLVFIMTHRSEVEKIVRALDSRSDNIQNKE